jgi:hypothetical protein
MPSDAVIKLRPLLVRQLCGVRFQAFPDRIDLASQIAHTPYKASAVFPLAQERWGS